MPKITLPSVRLVQIIPVADFRLYGEMVQKEIELRSKRGAFKRSGPKESNRAKWEHSTYKGWINLERTSGEVVAAEIRSRSESEDHWQILHAFIGWVDRHFGDKILALQIHYRD